MNLWSSYVASAAGKPIEQKLTKVIKAGLARASVHAVSRKQKGIEEKAQIVFPPNLTPFNVLCLLLRYSMTKR